MKLYGLVTLALLALSLLLIACGGDDPEPTPTAPPATAQPAPTATAVPETARAPAPITAATAARTATAFRLTILHNNDGESQLVDLGSDLEDFGGVARFAAVVQRERQAAASEGGSAGLIVVSSGDNFLASAAFTAGRRAGTFYDAIAIDLIGYDAIALGNHDFDFGPELLVEFIKQVSTSRAPFLSSNLDFSGEPVLQVLFDEGRIAESVVIEKNGQRFGIIGVTTPDLALRSSPRNVVVIADLAVEVQEEVDKLEADGVNKIILVSHLRQISDEIGLLATHIPS